MTMPADGTPLPTDQVPDGVQAPTGTEDDFTQFLQSLEGTGFEYPATLSSVLEAGAGGSPQASPTDDEELDDDGNPIDPTAQATPVVPEQGTQAPAPQQQVVRIGDVDVPLEEVQAFYELGKAIREGGVQLPVATAPVVTPPPVVTPLAPPAIPDFIDQEDPVQMGLWAKLQEVEGKLDGVSSANEVVQQRFVHDMAQQQLNAALSDFRTSYPNLTDEDLALIRPHAASLLPAVQTMTPDPVQAMKRSLYLAGLEIPGTQQKIIAPDAKTAQQKSQERKLKQSSLGGSSGSAPRSPSRPNLSTDKSMTGELASAIEEAFSSNGRLN